MKLLREFISAVLDEVWEDRADIYRNGKEREEELRKLDRDKFKGPQNYGVAVEMNREAEIEEKQELAEYSSVEAFAAYAYDDELEGFTDVDLQALARNVFGVEALSSSQFKSVKDDLIGYGFKFIPRVPVQQFRGARSNAHGTHPFANSGGGGSGFSSGGLALGTGPGAIGGKTKWDASSSKNLPMGSKRR